MEGGDCKKTDPAAQTTQKAAGSEQNREENSRYSSEGFELPPPVAGCWSLPP